jgi:hypothetical protein
MKLKYILLINLLLIFVLFLINLKVIIYISIMTEYKFNNLTVSSRKENKFIMYNSKNMTENILATRE